ncbi:MAG: hypothetical protein R3B51_07150 [Thermodesulfobacteriota bacterium]
MSVGVLIINHDAPEWFYATGSSEYLISPTTFDESGIDGKVAV